MFWQVNRRAGILMPSNEVCSRISPALLRVSFRAEKVCAKSLCTHRCPRVLSFCWSSFHDFTLSKLFVFFLSFWLVDFFWGGGHGCEVFGLGFFSGRKMLVFFSASQKIENYL